MRTIAHALAEFAPYFRMLSIGLCLGFLATKRYYETKK